MDEFQRVAVEGIELLEALGQVVEVDAHGVPVEARGIAQVGAEAALPEDGEVGRQAHARIAPLGRVALEVVGAQLRGDVDLLAGNGYGKSAYS